MQKYKSNITTTSGAAVRGAPVLVIKEDGSNAALFLDRAGTVPAPNPLTTGPDGVFYFYAVNGRYSIRTTVEGVTITDDDVVLLMDPEEITVAGPIAEAVAAAQAAAIAAEFAVEDSGIPVLVAAAQNAAVDANNAVSLSATSANNAAISKTGADSARDAAVAAKNAAEAALDSFDDRYLGAKAVAPTTDNDGGALLPGALYWDTVLGAMRAWSGSVWVTLPATTAASISYLPSGTGAMATTVQSKLREVVSVRDFGAVGDGVTDDTAAIIAASAAANGNGEVVFPNGSYNFAFSKPPYGVTWKFAGTDITRQALGGSGTAVRFFRPKLTYIDGPHELNQVQVEHDRVIAKGSNAIGAQYADYAYGNTIEKENWSETSGVPVAGEINNITLFHRNGCVTGDPVKTGGAGILANLGQTAGSGYTQLLEAVNSVFTKGTLAVQKQTNMQLLGIDEKSGESYGAVFNSVVGNQTCVIRVTSTPTSAWSRLLESYIGPVNNFFLDVAGKLRWRVNGTSMSLSQDSATSATVFRNEAGTAMLYATPKGYAGLRTVNVQTGTTYTINTAELSGDLGKTVVLANAAAITVTLPNNAPVGFHFEAIQRDPGQVTFEPASGATLDNVNAHTKTQGQYAVVRLRVRGNTGGTGAFWVMDGATAA